jgi:predicted amidohydrolase
MQDLKIAAIQSSLEWENPIKNREIFDKKIDQISIRVDLILLPEMFSTGFTLNATSVAEPMNGPTMTWMEQKAKEFDCVLGGSLLIRDAGKFYNRFIWMKPDGTYEKYDKRHLFSMAGEDQIMSRGSEKKIVEFKGWKINLQICYDLRFPVWSKNNYKNGKYDYDLMIYIANWPEVRNVAYQKLLPARAIENQCYVIWVNRVGKDGNRVVHSGDSSVIDPRGKIQTQAPPHQEEIVIEKLSYDWLEQNRIKFKVGLDWDDFQIFT